MTVSDHQLILITISEKRRSSARHERPQGTRESNIIVQYLLTAWTVVLCFSTTIELQLKHITISGIQADSSLIKLIFAARASSSHQRPLSPFPRTPFSPPKTMRVRHHPMALLRATFPFLLLQLILPASATFDCTFTISTHKFDLTPLRGVHAVFKTDPTPPSIENTTVFVDLCQDLRWDEKLFPVDDRCKDGTQGTSPRRVHFPFGDFTFLF